MTMRGQHNQEQDWLGQPGGFTSQVVGKSLVIWVQHDTSLADFEDRLEVVLKGLADGVDLDEIRIKRAAART